MSNRNRRFENIYLYHCKYNQRYTKQLKISLYNFWIPASAIYPLKGNYTRNSYFLNTLLLSIQYSRNTYILYGIKIWLKLESNRYTHQVNNWIAANLAVLLLITELCQNWRLFFYLTSNIELECRQLNFP